MPEDVKDPEKSAVTRHDPSYKDIFSHPLVLADLFQGFVHEEWVREIDFKRVEKSSTSFVDDRLHEHVGDLLWKVPVKGQNVYVYLMFEFQSTFERFMPVRIMTYLGLLYEDLLKRTKDMQGGHLPAVFPIVIYNGSGVWRAPQEISELIYPMGKGLERYCPRLTFFLLDLNRVNESDIPLWNTVSDIIRLERGPDLAGCRTIVHGQCERLKGPGNAMLRRTLAAWIKHSILTRLIPGVEIPEVRELEEVDAMLQENVVPWTERWKREGIEEGILQGIEKGIEKGIEQGIEQGIEKGIEQGIEKGREQGREEQTRDLVRRLLTKRFGALSEGIEERLRIADLLELETYADRLLDAPTLDAVFLDG